MKSKLGNSNTGKRDSLVKTLKGDNTEIVPADGLGEEGKTFPSLTLDRDIVDVQDLAVGDKLNLGLEVEVQTVIDDAKNPTVTFKITGVSANE